MISVVIPTRERCDTLVSTLRTCTEQNYDKLEIIVSDNASADRTQAYVNSAQDERIRYIRTERRLSMSHNWEFALSHVRGDYVTYVGDDDGLLPGALSALAEIIRETNTEAISWRWASYFWPSSLHAPSQNLLFVPAGGRLQRRSAPEVLRRVLSFREGYEKLPFLYKGIVSTRLTEQVKKASGGAFFHSMVPDVYSAIALSLVVAEYYYSTRPYSLNGTSAASNGAAQFTPSLNASAAKTFLDEDNIPFHADLALAPSLPIAVAESFFQARERLVEAREFSLSIDELMQAAMRDIANGEESRYLRVRDALQIIAVKHGLSSQLESLLDRFPNRPQTDLIGLTEGFNIIHNTHIVDCARLGITNIHQAAHLCAAIMSAGRLGFMRNPISTMRDTGRLGIRYLRRIFNKWTHGGSTKGARTAH
jgi:glycosyltransferase involved in cell wall biosynthesis